MGKRILITGAGKGKSFLAALLAEKYTSEGIECEVTHMECAEQVAELCPPSSGYQVVVSNSRLDIVDVWKTIVVEDGNTMPKVDRELLGKDVIYSRRNHPRCKVIEVVRGDRGDFVRLDKYADQLLPASSVSVVVAVESNGTD